MLLGEPSLSGKERSDAYFAAVAEHLSAKAAQVIVDLTIYDGSAMSLLFDTRQATRDVDAVARGAVDFLRSFVAEIAEQEGSPSDWLNDGVQGFVSANENIQRMGDFQASSGRGLRVHTSTPEYLFAMKYMAMRPEIVEASHDISDIEAPAKIAGITDVASASSLVETFYPASRIPPKVRFGVEKIIERLNRHR